MDIIANWTCSIVETENHRGMDRSPFDILVHTWNTLTPEKRKFYASQCKAVGHVYRPVRNLDRDVCLRCCNYQVWE